MALIGRIFVVIFSFLIACVAAALVMVFAVVLPTWSNLFDDTAAYHSFAIVVGLSATLFCMFAMVPAMLLIAIAEGSRVRSVLFYAIAGGALALLAAYGLDFAAPSIEPDEAGSHFREVLAAAGIVGGFVYWALAGRNAGKWRV